MKYAQILETLTRTPLLMAPASADSLLHLFQAHAALSAEDFKAAREGVDMCGDKVAMEQMTIEGGIAAIPINGPLGIRLGKFEKGAGAVDYLDIMRELKEAQENDAVSAIVLHFDTPGGMFSGLPETADLIASSDKPIYSYVPAGAMCCSAGMWLAASTDGIFASQSASVGSIGVYSTFTDMSAMAEARGIKVKLFTSGKYKGMGVPGTSLSADQETHLQESVMSMAEDFYNHIRENRSGVPDSAMQGQSFRAAEAMKNGLVDDVIKEYGELLSYLK